MRRRRRYAEAATGARRRSESVANAVEPDRPEDRRCKSSGDRLLNAVFEENSIGMKAKMASLTADDHKANPRGLALLWAAFDQGTETRKALRP